MTSGPRDDAIQPSTPLTSVGNPAFGGAERRLRGTPSALVTRVCARNILERRV